MPAHITKTIAAANTTTANNNNNNNNNNSSSSSSSSSNNVAVIVTNHVQLRVFVDHSVLEVYDGTAAMSFQAFPSNMAAARGVQLTPGRLGGVNASLRVYEMEPAVVVVASL